jgi:hypothetical protein
MNEHPVEARSPMSGLICAVRGNCWRPSILPDLSLE